MNKDNHEGCEDHAKVALDHSAKAHAVSTAAHEKSAQPVAVGAR